jgi:hypothetical protein
MTVGGDDESNEEFIRRLSRDFTAERWMAVFTEMHKVFMHYVKTRGQERTRELVDLYNDTLPHLAGDAKLVDFAYSQAMAEGVLAAVSHYVAIHEPPTTAS